MQQNRTTWKLQAGRHLDISLFVCLFVWRATSSPGPSTLSKGSITCPAVVLLKRSNIWKLKNLKHKSFVKLVFKREGNKHGQGGIRLDKRRQSWFVQKHHERKRAEETIPQRKQRLKANRELQTPFWSDTYSEKTSNKGQSVEIKQSPWQIYSIPYLVTRSLQECNKICMLIIFPWSIVLIRFCRQFRHSICSEQSELGVLNDLVCLPSTFSIFNTQSLQLVGRRSTGKKEHWFSNFEFIGSTIK